MESINQYGRPCWVIGNPIDHTLSPRIHNQAFEAEGLPHRYFAMEVESNEVSTFVECFKQIDGLGANLTLPLKEEIINHVSVTSERVQDTGAANTLYWDEDELALENTDVYGFKKLVEGWKETIRTRPVILLGAGGAARACVRALYELECNQIRIWNRTKARAHEISDSYTSMNIEVLSDEQLENETFEEPLVVNATSLGLNESDPSPFPVEQIQFDMVAVDLIYGRETKFIKQFKSAGCDYTDGADMLVHQAAKAWELWTSREAPVPVMHEAMTSEG